MNKNILVSVEYEKDKFCLSPVFNIESLFIPVESLISNPDKSPSMTAAVMLTVIVPNIKERNTPVFVVVPASKCKIVNVEVQTDIGKDGYSPSLCSVLIKE